MCIRDRQHGAAGVYQHIPALVFQRDAALRHQQQIAGVLIRRQLVAVRIQPQGMSAFQMTAACYANGVNAWIGGGALGRCV